jgi:hypothetical protein
VLVTGDDVIRIACHGCLQKLVVIRVSLDGRNLFIGDDEFREISECFDFGLDFFIVQSEALRIFL